MSIVKMPAKYTFRTGETVSVSSLASDELLYVAWLQQWLQSGARYHDMLTAVAAPSAFALGGKPSADDEIRNSLLFRIACDMLARAGEREGLNSEDLEAVQPGVYHSVTEAAQRLGISRAAVVQAIHEQRLAAYRLG